MARRSGEKVIKRPNPRTLKQKTKKYAGIDTPFLVLTVILMAIGLVMLFSASYAIAYYENNPSTYYFLRQGFFAVTGIGFMLALANIDYRIFRKLAPAIIIVSAILLVAVLIFGKGNFAEKRWLDFGLFQFQPSEVAKLAVIIFFARIISIHHDKIKTFKHGVLPFVGILLLFGLLMYLEPHYSGLIIICLVGGTLMFVGGTDLKWFIIAAIGAAAAIAILIVAKGGYAFGRIETWLDPFADPKGDGYQIVQSFYAIGSGGLLGLGFGNSRQKYLYLPEAHNDFIFAIVCEELGFIGALIILALFALLIWRGYWIALHARDRFGAMLAAGITTQVAVQTVLNISVVTGVLPVTGAALPFFSYGGTALWVLLAEMGIVLSVSKYSPIKSEE